jgi:hypothetical protein
VPVLRPENRVREPGRVSVCSLSCALEAQLAWPAVWSGHCATKISRVSSRWLNSRTLAAASPFPQNERKSLTAAPIRYEPAVAESM